MASKMASLMDLVSQNQPKFQTHQALLVIGLQNDFVLSDGRLPVNTTTGFLDRIQALVPKFRELSGNVIWVQTLYEADRIATGADTGEGDALVVGGLIDGDESEAGDEDLVKEAASLPAQSKSSKHKQRALDLLKRVSARRKTLPKEIAKATVEEDDELFLLKSEKRTPACVPKTHGAEFIEFVTQQMELPADAVIRTTHYSAFQGTNLLITLRARLVTELFICGCITNVSVLATVIDAARHGIKICVVEDCLGFRKQNRHELALKRMDDFFDAYLVNSEEILEKEPPEIPQKPTASSNGAKSDSKDSGKTVEALLANMSLGEEGQSLLEKELRPKEKPEAEQSNQPTDKEFSDLLVKGATVPGVQEEKPKLVKTKIRMRSGKTKKKKKKDKGESNGDTPDDTGEPSTSATLDTVDSTPTTDSAALKSTETPADAQRTSQIAKAGSVADLRGKETRPHALKNAASVPILSTKGGEEKDKNKISGFSDRVRLSLSRAPKSESGSDAKRGSATSSKAASTTSKQEEKEVQLPAKENGQPASAQSEQPTVELLQGQAPALSTATPVVEPSSAPMPSKPPKLKSLANLPVLGPGDEIAEGDSRIIHDFFPTDLRHPFDRSHPLKDLVFSQLYNEIRWQKMLHQQGEVPRLVCCQGAFEDDGSMPVYRHPADQTLPLLRFSPTVQIIRKQAEKLVGHPLNHVLIQLYRSGNDFISEHSDKTLDIVKGSSIVNVSFGSQRTMRLRRKKLQSNKDETLEDGSITQRETQRVPLPHNSMFVLGLESNNKWLHGIQPDKRLASERSEAETSHNGIRISLTLRHIGTFLDSKESTIWGQGATTEERRDAADVINGDEEEAKRIITAFSRENHDPDFDWDKWYGEGFDVLHLQTPPKDVPLLFASNNPIETQQVQIALAECKISYSLIEAPAIDTTYERDRHVTFRDADTHHTEVHTPFSILLYLDRYHALDTSPASHPVTASAYPTMLVVTDILKTWQQCIDRSTTKTASEFEESLSSLLHRLEADFDMHGGPFVAGSRFSIADCFAWPVVDALVDHWEGWHSTAFVHLDEWYRACWRKKACVKKIKDKLGEARAKEKV
jgi:nicotinamidase-related amidase/alkylated DNA repair dioxygenase AlkB